MVGIKATFVALACLLLAWPSLASRRKLRAGRAVKSFDCPGNKFPLDPTAKYGVLGKAKFSPVFPVEDLQAGLASIGSWEIGKGWNLTLTANSDRKLTTKFGFAGGSGGFMEFSVPGGMQNDIITVTGVVKSSGKETIFEFRGDEVVTDNDVTLTDICLTPSTCQSYTEGCGPGFKLLADLSKEGSSPDECCEAMMCAKEDPCKPESAWRKAADFETRSGGTKQACCEPLFCSADVCNSTKWKPLLGSGRPGSTPAECCEARMCMEFDCEKSSEYVRMAITKEYQTLQGSTFDECCEIKKCKHFECTTSQVWKDKEDKQTMNGNSFLECCEPAYCEDFDCPTSTKYRPLNSTSEGGERRRGNSPATCCEELKCQDHNCSAGWGLKTTHHTLLGSTDAECCEQKNCGDYKCSSDTKWVHKATVLEKVDHRGDSDEECCEPIFCENYHCLPVSQYRKKVNVSGLQGSSIEECCEPIYCEAFNCTGDFDGDGDSSAWYKKKDTNNHKYIGSTDEECCVPKFCSQYTTQFPSKYTRKSGNHVLGSTDFECYDPRWCKDYQCQNSSKVLKPCELNLLGSSDEECCMIPVKSA
mmetsp:Transcript_101126/g.241036  ORF Transcript_101126/g.241036 Transcript_101126/m.241036 type:complete len:587 (-) Transcript_101126:45-1805(-)